MIRFGLVLCVLSDIRFYRVSICINKRRNERFGLAEKVLQGSDVLRRKRDVIDNPIVVQNYEFHAWIKLPPS